MLMAKAPGSWSSFMAQVLVPSFWPGVLTWVLASNIGQEALLVHVTGLVLWPILLAQVVGHWPRFFAWVLVPGF